MVIVIFLHFTKIKIFLHNHVSQSAKFLLSLKMMLRFLDIILASILNSGSIIDPQY